MSVTVKSHSRMWESVLSSSCLRLDTAAKGSPKESTAAAPDLTMDNCAGNSLEVQGQSSPPPRAGAFTLNQAESCLLWCQVTTQQCHQQHHSSSTLRMLSSGKHWGTFHLWRANTSKHGGGRQQLKAVAVPGYNLIHALQNHRITGSQNF